MTLLRILALVVCVVPAAGQTPAAQPKPAPATPAAKPRVDSASRRNENIQVNRIDNEAVKEAGIRLGASTTIVAEAPVESTYYATEHGRPAGETVFLRPAAPPQAWHAELTESHQNSIFNARTFFQVGPVKPSRRNYYGGRFTAGLGRAGAVTVNANQRKIRGMVNGNLLAPLANERTPTATDPAVRALVARWLDAYPAGLPNRPDFDARALNTNAPQRIDETDGDIRLDPEARPRGRMSAMYGISRQRVDAFQFVAGQNPDTEIHSHRARLSYRHAFSPATDVALGAAFQRVRSLLLPEPNAVGPRVRFGFQIEELGPDSMFPINRALNTWRGGASGRTLAGGGRHALSFGADMTRYQLNGIESNNQRGFFQFTNNFGRTALQNFLMGTPTQYEATMGELARGFRNWAVNAFFGDKAKVTPALDVYFGIRYGIISAPIEVNSLNEAPYACDCNNFSPRFAVAWRARGGWVVRTSYSVSFGDIPAVTYQQVRNNLPLVRYVSIQNPDLLNPLAGIDLRSPAARTSPTVFARDLVAPYAHQYNFSIERRIQGRYLVRAGYVGSRSIKLLSSYIFNRAQPLPEIALTTATVDQRRADPRYYDVKQIVNGGIAYLDAAQASVEIPLARDFTGGATYTFGKAIDEGADYSATAANNDLLKGRSQWESGALKDKRGLSTFDSTHALAVYWSYELPRVTAGAGALARIANGWQASGAGVMKSGTPLTLYVGSDAPGFGNVDGGPSDRPNILDPSILGMTIGDPNTAPSIIRRDRFAYIRPGELRGSLGRNTFRKSPIANFNAALARQWRFGNGTERSVMFRAEAYNLTNHPQFDEPQRNLSSPAFGKITNTLNDGRVFQFGLRVIL